MKQKKSKALEDILIDKFYDEAYDTFWNLKTEKTEEEFLKSLKLIKENLSFLEEYNPNIDIDVIKIVEKGISHKAKRKEIISFAIFITASFLVLCCYLLFINSIGFENFAFVQILAGILLPWLLIPFSLISKRRKERA